jgi:hypothetical protein
MWLFFERELNASSDVVSGISSLRKIVAPPEYITDLRLVDIVVWYRQTPTGRLREEESSCEPIP